MTLGKTGAIAAACIAGVIGAGTLLARAQQIREVSINGSQYAFSPGRIEVQRNDVVKITFTATDMAHSFTVDSYRIAKRAGAGQSVTFEFRADQPGEHTFYCNLTHDEKCRDMKGTLVVR
jgi:heme/copper-type cytochrome/quinol oxidase subunit 2